MRLSRLLTPSIAVVMTLIIGAFFGVLKVPFSDASQRPIPLYVVVEKGNDEMVDSWTANGNVGSVDSITVADGSVTITGWVNSKIDTIRILGPSIEPSKRSVLTSARDDVAETFDDESLRYLGFSVTVRADVVDCIWFSGLGSDHLVYASEDSTCS